MCARLGRPPKSVKKNINLGLRISEETANKLRECADAMHISRTAVIEKGIDLVRQSIKK